MQIFNIKTKITLWYTVFMIILISIILGMLVEFTGITILTDQKKQLVEVVKDVIEDIEEKDKFDFFDDGVFILIYDENNNFIDGSIPQDFSLDTPLISKQVQEIKGKNRFYIYDQKITTSNRKVLWIRGVVSDIYSNQITKTILTLSFILLPILVILSSIIGYYITKRAFLPVKKIQETAENIASNNKLSLRIGLPEGKDEISKLGNTIDKMLDKLENSFIKEKQFTSDASHELRTPISVILAESEYILKHGETFEEAKESMEVINRQTQKMSALINQLLFFTRNDQGSIKLKLENVNIEKILENLKEDNSFNAKEKNITISYFNKLSKNEYQVDKILFIRAIQNIVENAISYGKINGYIKIESFEIDKYFAIKIEDNGIGISSENIKKIWDRFYQVDESRSTKSMGLGLSMVKVIVEKHEGYIEVNSSLGIGTTFTLYFKKL